MTRDTENGHGAFECCRTVLQAAEDSPRAAITVASRRFSSTYRSGPWDLMQTPQRISPSNRLARGLDGPVSQWNFKNQCLK
jgi:hypothetical protein